MGDPVGLVDQIDCFWYTHADAIAAYPVAEARDDVHRHHILRRYAISATWEDAGIILSWDSINVKLVDASLVTRRHPVSVVTVDGESSIEESCVCRWKDCPVNKGLRVASYLVDCNLQT